MNEASPIVFKPLISENWRYKVYYGGRGSGKSWAFATALIELAISKRRRILCTREYQNSIEDSVYKLISDFIDKYGYSKIFSLTRTGINCLNGSEFVFTGLHRNINSIRSLEGIDYCWVEEAGIVSEESWEILIPTIRKEDSEIWVSFNPENENDPAYRRFVKNKPENAFVRKVTWADNPWFPEVLRKEMEHDRAVDPDLYMHIWEGELRKLAVSQIFHGKWTIEDFETPADAQFYCGADWGFATDPTAIVRCFIRDGKLYVDKEAGGHGVEIDETGLLLDQILPYKNWPTRGDNSRPETISFLRRQGYNIIPSTKGSGSIEDGIAFLRSFDTIVIHPRCRQTIEEMRLYSYKTDRITGDVLPIPIDMYNHYIDALRYAVEPVMRKQRFEIL